MFLSFALLSTLLFTLAFTQLCKVIFTLVCDGAFFAKIFNGSRPLAIYYWINFIVNFDWVLNTTLHGVTLNYNSLRFVNVL